MGSKVTCLILANLSREIYVRRYSRNLKLRKQLKIRLKIEKNENICVQMAAPSLQLLIQGRNELWTLTAKRTEYRLGAPYKSLSKISTEFHYKYSFFKTKEKLAANQ